MQECDECTLCCKLTTVHGQYCKEYVHGRGCTIYKDRPEHCKTFECSYLQMKKVNPELRPDRCGMMFEKINNTLMLGTIEDDIDSLSEIAIKQIASFRREGISTMVQQSIKNKSRCFLAENSNKQKILQALRDKKNDSSPIF